MACDITAGRLEGCKDSVGGLNAIYFINYGAPEGFAVTDETITGVTATTPSAFKYDLKGTSTFDQSLTSSRDNGTTFAEQTLTVSLKKQDATTSTGASLGDKSGYELVFAGMEKGLAKSYTGVLATDFAITVGA